VGPRIGKVLTSGILRSAAGYHVVKLIRKVPAKLYSLPESIPPYYDQVVHDVIRSTLTVARQQEALLAQIEKTRIELGGQAEISIMEKNLGFPLSGRG
jgi:parvulin-like peptidyl-prolyl isomerase